MVGLALFVGAAGIGFRTPLMLWVGLIFVTCILAPIPFNARRVRRSAAERSYLLTDQRLLTDTPAGRSDLRLVNLPELGLELHGDGYGSISFTPPSGAGPERNLRRLVRWVPQLEDSANLMDCVPEAERVMQLLRTAQSTALASRSGPAMEATTPSGGPPTDAPVDRQPFMQAASVVPIWVGGIFLVVGLGVLMLVALVGLSGAREWWQPALVGVPFALIGALLVRARYRFVRQRRRLLTVGASAGGRVVDVAGTGTQVNDVEQWVVRYRFGVGGVERTGQSAMVPWATAARYAAGDEVEVTYDPTDPSVNTLAGPFATS